MGLTSYTHPDFWKYYHALPVEIRKLADKKFELFNNNPEHSSLGFAKKGKVWTVDIGLHYRAIGYKEESSIVWFWIGSHEDYNRVMKRF